jgi:flagellar motor switch protein FliN/FliY
MSELNLEIAEKLAETCKSASDEIAAALGRALGGLVGLEMGEYGQCDSSEVAEAFDGAGLIVLLHVGDKGLAIVLPARSELLPDWCSAPDATGQNRLKTLAQELGMLVLPAPLEASDSRVQQFHNVAAALARGGLAANAMRLTIELTSDEKTGQLSLVWPLETPDEMFEAAELVLPAATTTDSAIAGSASTAPPSAAKAASNKPRDIASLPGYSRSLLKISVPVCVQLAGKKESVQEVITLAPGSIIKFDKGCEELLQMIVGERTIAEGEAVKIGEKFGFRVTSMKLPPEHFVPVRKPRRA